MKTPEGYEKDDIKKYLDSIGAWYMLTYTGGYGRSGAPDIIACIDGMFWGIEVKREGKEPTKLQSSRLEAINKADGCGIAGDAKIVIQAIEAWKSWLK